MEKREASSVALIRTMRRSGRRGIMSLRRQRTKSVSTVLERRKEGRGEKRGVGKGGGEGRKRGGGEERKEIVKY